MKKQFTLLLLLLAATITHAQTWTQKHDFGGSERWGAISFSIGNKAYVGLGNDNTNKNDFWEWDQATNTWTQRASFPAAGRYQAVAFSIGNKGYVGTGAAGAAFPYTPLYNDFWEYDPAMDTWTQKASLPATARFAAVGFSIGNKGYIGTGFDAVTYFQKDFWEYDPVANSWTQKQDFGGLARMEAVGFSIGDKGYVGTGGNYMSGVDVLSDFWQYDPAANQWTQKADFGGAGRSTASGFAAGGHGYIGMGGDFQTLVYTDFWEYDPTNNDWTQRDAFSGTARWLSTGFGIGNKGYFATGGNFAPEHKDLWEYNTGFTAVDEPTTSDINVYPNPASKFLTAHTNGNEKFQIELCSLSGQTILNKTVANDERISIGDVPSGMYYVKIVSRNNALVTKLQILNP